MSFLVSFDLICSSGELLLDTPGYFLVIGDVVEILDSCHTVAAIIMINVALPSIYFEQKCDPLPSRSLEKDIYWAWLGIVSSESQVVCRITPATFSFYKEARAPTLNLNGEIL